MTLTEFLAQTDYDGADITLLSDADALIAAQAYTTTKIWRIEGAVRKTQVETTVIVNDTTDRLETNIVTLKALPAPTATESGQLALSKAILRALNTLYNPEFYINLADPEVAGMFANAQALGVLTASEIAGITTAATYNETPLSGTTLHDISLIRGVSETLLLTDNPAQHQVKFKIAVTPSKPTSIVIEQQFGDTDEDLTPWHSVGSVSVQYTQSTYKLMVPACDLAIRKLRAVSPLTLGLSEVI